MDERSEGRSLTQCREREERTASKVLGGKGRDSGFVRWVCVMGILGAESESSRWRSAGDVSAQVSWLMRSWRGILGVEGVLVSTVSGI